MGILVGRGTAPVTFNTESFQNRLAVLYEKLDGNDKAQEKPQLDFYNALKKTEDADEFEMKLSVVHADTSSAPTPESEEKNKISGTASEDKNVTVPLKKSRKAVTYLAQIAKKKTSPDTTSVLKKAESRKKTISSEKKTSLNKPRAIVPREQKPHQKTTEKSDDLKEKGVNSEEKYTIQIASFVDLNDARKHILLLHSKGYKPYMTTGTINGKKWHRVRTGAFKTVASSRQYLKKLESDGIKGIILSKE